MATPKLRFKEFSGDWSTSKIDEIASVTSGGTPSRANPKYWDGDIPWVTTSLVDCNVIQSAEEFITKEGVNNSSAKLFPKDTILMAMYGQGITRGKVAILGIEATTNQACCAIKLKNDFNTQFIFQNLMNRYEEIRDLSNEGGQKNLSAGIIKEIIVTYPSKEEQTKIASFLSTVDKKISQLTLKHELLSQYKQGMMQKLFSQQIRFKANDGSEFGEWEKSSLGEVTELVSRRNKDDIDAEIYSVTNSQGFVKQNEYFVDRRIAGEDTSAYKIIKFNEFAYNPARINVGSIALFDKAEVGVISSLYVCFSVNKNISIRFLEYFLKLDETIKNYGLYGEGGVRIYLWYPLFSKIPFDFPCLKEQIKIVNFLSVIDQKIEVVAQQIEQAKQWKKGLLQQMFV